MTFQRVITAIFSLALLVGCASTQTVALPQNLPKDWINISDTQEFELFAPPQFQERYLRDDGGVAFIYYDDNTVKRKPDDLAIIVFKNEQFSNCTNDYIGFSKPEEKVGPEGEIIHKGKLDYFDIYWTKDFPNAQEPFCGPFTIGGGYAFCSEKNGQKVLICLAKGKDDPKFADEIFSTFKWKN